MSPVRIVDKEAIKVAFLLRKRNTLISFVQRTIDAEFMSEKYKLQGDDLQHEIRAIYDPKVTSAFEFPLDPNDFFDADWYLSELDSSQAITNERPYVHYITSGSKLRLNPSPIFSNNKYFALNKDAKILGINPLLHYLLWGKKNKRQFSLSPIDENYAGTGALVKTNNSNYKLESVAVIIPVFNNWLWTERAIAAVLRAEPMLPKSNIFVIDDCSTDLTEIQTRRLFPGVTYRKNQQNLGFLRSCNLALKSVIKQGYSFAYLLNNDAEPLPGFLREALLAREEFPNAGIIGSRFLNSDGSNQESGGIIWKSGQGWNFERGRIHPSMPSLTTRPVDYCSGAGLLIDADTVSKVDFFDELFLPAYYEDVDLSFKFRELKLKTYIAPYSVVIHHEGKTHGVATNTGVKKFQVTNQEKFSNKWSMQLQQHLNFDVSKISSAAYRETLTESKKIILWVDYQFPDPTRDAGSVRAVELMSCARELDHLVIFVATNSDQSFTKPYWLQSRGILVMSSLGAAERFMKNVGRDFDIAWMSRVDVAAKYVSRIQKNHQSTKVIFDTVDLHFLRMERQSKLTSNRSLWRSAQRTKRLELKLMESTDTTVLVSSHEKTLLEELGIPEEKLKILSLAAPTRPRDFKAKDRKGLVFVGSFNHYPNTSGIHWFVEKVWPKLPEEIRSEGLRIVGQKPPDSLTQLDDKFIDVLGWVEDSDQEVASARVSIAPLLVGAGAKGKVAQAFLNSTPTVMTSIAAEGMGIKNGQHALIEDDPEEFASAICKIFYDPALAAELVVHANQLAEASYGRTQVSRVLTELLEVE